MKKKNMARKKILQYAIMVTPVWFSGCELRCVLRWRGEEGWVANFAFVCCLLEQYLQLGTVQYVHACQAHSSKGRKEEMFLRRYDERQKIANETLSKKVKKCLQKQREILWQGKVIDQKTLFHQTANLFHDNYVTAYFSYIRKYPSD